MLKILFLENDVVILDYFKLLIQKKFDCEVLTAVNGIEGLKILKKFNPDLILLNLFMPVMGGIEFLEIIRKNETFSHTPVLIISAAKDEKIISTLIDLKIEDYILKPFDIEITFDRIRKTIDTIRSSKFNKEISKKLNRSVVLVKDSDDSSYYEHNAKKNMKRGNREFDENNIENYEELDDSNLSESEKDRVYSKILGLKGKLHAVEIKKIYKGLVELYHPDKVSHLGKEIQIFADKKTKDLNKAYSYFKKKYNL